MNRIVVLALALGAGVFLPASAGEVYKWVDKEGAVHYGDRPPDDAGAHQVNTSGLPLPLQARLRSLDPYFSIVHFGGNTQVGFVCGEFDPEAAGSYEPRFAAQVEATNLGTVKIDNSAEAHMVAPTRTYYGYYGGYNSGANYPTGKCGWTQQRDTRMQRRVYEIRFNPETVRAYQAPAAAGGH